MDCIHCSRDKTKEGHDGCIGTLPDPEIMNACCGHGETRDAYIQYQGGTWVGGDSGNWHTDGFIVRGEEAIKRMWEWSNGKTHLKVAKTPIG